MGLISPGGENLLDFLELWQVLSTSDGDRRDPLWWHQERPVPMRFAPGPLGLPLPSCWDLRAGVESLPEHEVSSSVLTWILGCFWSLPRVVSSPLEWGHARALSSRAVSSSVTLPVEWIKGSVAFHQRFPTKLSHEDFPQGCPRCHRGVIRS